MKANLDDLASRYRRDGFVSPVRLFSANEADKHREVMEAAEAKIGKLHYQAKVHTVLRSPFELASHPRVLDLVEQLLGPDILIYNVEFIVKEPRTPSFVSWHQDLTYWGFDSDDQVSMWLALSPATKESGCMRMVPGSHANGMLEHVNSKDENNVLFQGQSVQGVDESKAVVCALEPGEATFHHGWTLHASFPNQTDERRIGLNVQYLKPSMKQMKHEADSALLVRGEDRYGHYLPDVPAEVDLDPAALERFRTLNDVHRAIAADDRIVDQA